MQISTQNLRKIYQKKNVVDDVSISVGKGEVVGLLGPNGAGKTTTFYMVVGLVRPDQGRIFLGDRDITDLPMHLRAREGIGYLAQEPSVFRKLTVEDNIMAVLEVMKLPLKQRKEILESLLAEFHIEHIRNRFGYMLSGGERRRVEIARALAISPSFILLDEPFAGVDPISVMDIQEIISHLKTKGLGVLITDHNVRETLAITDRAYIIHQGKILEAGSAEHITNSEIAKKFYLGEKFTL